MSDAVGGVYLQVGDLKHNKDLDALAQCWAEQLAVTNDLKYSNDTYKGDELGENIASKWATGGADYTGKCCSVGNYMGVVAWG